MIQETIFSRGDGEGFIADNPDEINSLIRPTTYTLAGESISPGDLTDLAGFLSHKVPYLGALENGGMVFLLGDTGGLFPLYYYDVIHRITDTKLFIMFSTQAGRDFILRADGTWK